MKRRVKTQPSNPFYSNEPAVATGMIADKAPVQNASLGNKSGREIDKHPGRMSGIAGFVSKSKPSKGSSHIKLPKLGSKAKQPTQTRVSRGVNHTGIKNLKKI
jgi:hypothetical protein